MGRGIVRGQKINPGQLERAKALRTGMTAAEKILWKKLRSNRLGGFHFRRQQPVFGYIADFYCDRAGLVVEVDGGIHQGQLEYDRERDAVLRAGGLVVLRFTNDAVLHNVGQVLDAILEACGHDYEQSPCHDSAPGVQSLD